MTGGRLPPYSGGMKGTDIDGIVSAPDFAARKPIHCEPEPGDTHAVRHFKEKIKEKVLFKYATYVGGSRNFAFKVYHLIEGPGIGRRRAALGFAEIFSLREKIRPAMWYVPADEPLPPLVKWEPGPAKKTDVWTRWSCGRLLLSKMKEDAGSWTALASRFGPAVTEPKLRFLAYKYSDGKSPLRFKTLPSPAVVQALAGDISPDLWFVFPEELSDSRMRRRFVEMGKGRE